MRKTLSNIALVAVLAWAAFASAPADAAFEAWRECAVTKWIISWNDTSTSGSAEWYNTFRVNQNGSRTCVDSVKNPAGCTSPSLFLTANRVHLVRQCPAGCPNFGSCVENSNPVTIPTANCMPQSLTEGSQKELDAYDQLVYLGSLDLYDNPYATVDALEIADHLDAIIAFHKYEFTAERREWVLLSAINALQSWKVTNDNWEDKERLQPFPRPKMLPPDWVPASRK